APFVFHHATTVTVRRVERFFESARTGIECASILRVGIAYVDVEKSSHPVADSGVANHQHGIADRYDRWSVRLVVSRRSEHLSEEFYEPFGIVNDDSRSYRMPAFRGGTGTVRWLVHWRLLVSSPKQRINPLQSLITSSRCP